MEKQFTDFKKKLLNKGLSQQDALKQLRLKDVPPSGFDTYNYLKIIPTLDAMQKMMEFYHNKGIDMLKLGCTILNLANICLHKSANQKNFPFVGSDKDIHDKIREDMTGGLYFVFTRKAVVDQTYTRK